MENWDGLATEMVSGRIADGVDEFYHSPCEAEFQSLAQMNVGQRHCVPFSFSPLGPRGRGQIQNARPRFMPGFFVVKLMQGSWWLSQRGGAFLVKSLFQSSLLTMGSMTMSVWNLLGEDCVERVSAVEIWVSVVDSKGCEVAPTVLETRVVFALVFVGDDDPS